MKWAACVTGSKTITNSSGSCSDISAFSPGGSSIASMVIFSRSSSNPVSGRSPRAPENLSEMFPDREQMGIVGRDSPQARADRKGDFDHFVECRFITGSGERAVVGLLVHGPERVGGIEHAATARTENVPGQLEQPEPRSVQETGDRLFLAQPVFDRKQNQKTWRQKTAGSRAEHDTSEP